MNTLLLILTLKLNSESSVCSFSISTGNLIVATLPVQAIIKFLVTFISIGVTTTSLRAYVAVESLLCRLRIPIWTTQLVP